MPIPNETKRALLAGEIDLDADTIKVALFNDTSSYSFDQDTHNYVGDVLDGGTTAEEFGGSGGSGYSRQTLGNLSVTTDDADDEGVFDADDVTWSSLDGETIQGIIVYKQVGTDDSTPGDDPIVAVIDDTDTGDLPLITNGGQVDLTWAVEGILNLG